MKLTNIDITDLTTQKQHFSKQPNIGAVISNYDVTDFTPYEPLESLLQPYSTETPEEILSAVALPAIISKAEDGNIIFNESDFTLNIKALQESAKNNITFTIYTSSYSELSKKYYREDGAIKKQASAQMTNGKAMRVTMPFENFPEVIAKVSENQAFGYGTHPSEYKNIVGITTKHNAKPDQGLLARTKDYFGYPQEGGVLMIDHDPSMYGANLTSDELIKVLIEIHPQIGQAAHLCRNSVSAGVHLTGKESTGSTGFHAYIPVCNAYDIPRYGQVLFDRLWLKGYGYIDLSSNGSLLVRTVIDGSVFSPERLDFVSQPIIQGEGLEWTPPAMQYVSGGSLDTMTLADLSSVELVAVKRLQDEAKAAIKPSSESKCKEWVELTVEKIMQQKGATDDLARKTIKGMLANKCNDLYGIFPLEFSDDMGTFTVAHVLDNPKLFDKKSLADPIEGKEYGVSTAKFYWNDGNKPCINSFAHGGQQYFLFKNLEDGIYGSKLSTLYQLVSASKLKRNDKNQIIACLLNVCSAIDDKDFIDFNIGFDEFREELMFHCGDGQWQPFCDQHYTELRMALAVRGFTNVRQELMRDAVSVVAYRNKFDSAKVWLNSLNWDGVSRIETFFIRYFEANDAPYARSVAFYTWTAMAGRVLSPGCQADMVPVLLGNQGMGKSTALAAMVPSPEHFCEISLNEKDDDLSRKMRGTLIAELAELRGLNTKDLETIKSFITRRHEKWTPKFKEFTTTFPRRLIMIGTTNQEEFLADPTGNRRFLPIVVTKADRKAIAADYKQLWAEAAVLFNATGVAWQDAERLAHEEHSKFEIIDPLEEKIETWLQTPYLSAPNKMKPEDRDGISTTDIIEECLKVDPRFWVMTPGITKKVGVVMRKLGYKHKQVRRDGFKQYLCLWFH
ncbi:virulence-associated E family protein [Methylobacter svalbardensis]|uniref:virulence-associated E family protein n=1 Tax=Methylobacter svalbardensis TaxID=3080016 RepID=UPI0030ECFA84